jgi:superfamily II DNA or RNA helicase
MIQSKGQGRKKKVKTAAPRTPRTRKPANMSVEEWQVALRREFGREQAFKVKNMGTDPIFSEFELVNPKTEKTYRVAIRGTELGSNYCSCPDFAVNTLGTCKHVEWLLAKLERKPGAKKAFKEGFQPAYSEVYLRYGAQRLVCWRAGTACPRELASLAKEYFGSDGVLRPEAYAEFDEFARKANSYGHDVRIYDDALAFIAQVRDDAIRRRRIAEAFPQNGRARSMNGLVKVKLYPYQQEGALFAATAGRCLIADDMGLGKTVQAIAAVEILARTMGVQRVLVVAPTALKHQWKQEVERFSNRDATVVEGLLTARRRLYRAPSFYKIVNYDVVHLDLEAIAEWAPDVVILDEAQRIKNWQTRRAKVIKQIPSEYAIVLTGTPLENRLEELHSIMEFVDRFRLGPLFRFVHEHQHTDETGRVIGYRNLDRISKSLERVLVRRRKGEVLRQLPERTDKHFFVDMTPEQAEHHEENAKIVAEIVAKWRRMSFLSDKDHLRLMIALQNMRMACNSTYLLDKETDFSVKPDEFSLLLDDLLEHPENKVVVFSQWLGTHELLIRRLDAAKRPYAYYHGSLDGKGRKRAIERFKKDTECRILLCTDSGGLGLNLQEGSIVIIMDQPWNPAVLEQRVGRVHRLGQHRPVQVYHFVSQGTIEHGMLNVLRFKSSVFAGVLDGGDKDVFLDKGKAKKFMETVADVVNNVPTAMPPHEKTAPDSAADGPPDEKPAAGMAKPASAAPNPWNDVLEAGLGLFGKVAQALQPAGESFPDILARISAATSSALAKNEQTGTAELRIPLPDPDTINRIADALGGLAGLLRGRRQ